MPDIFFVNISRNRTKTLIKLNKALAVFIFSFNKLQITSGLTFLKDKIKMWKKCTKWTNVNLLYNTSHFVPAFE